VLAWQLALAGETPRSGAVSAVAEESLANAAVIQAYTREASEVSRLLEQGDGAVDAEMESTRLRGLFSLLTDALELAGGLLVVAVGTWELDKGNLSIGGFVAFLAYVSQLYSPIRRLGQLINTVHGASASAERIIELLDEQPTVVDCSSPGKSTIAKLALRFYDPDEGRLLIDGRRGLPSCSTSASRARRGPTKRASGRCPISRPSRHAGVS
jgi:ATP-binding cassette, subfamily B, bacterial